MLSPSASAAVLPIEHIINCLHFMFNAGMAYQTT